MPAYFETGFVVRQPAWHGMADVLPEAVRSEEALVAAGLDWEVDYAPIFAEIPGVGSVHVPGRKVTVRMDRHEPLGVVGLDWTAVQNRDAFRFLDQLVDSGDLLYETAGSLHRGAVVWMLARFPEHMELSEGEIVKRYLLAWNGHAGTRAFGVKCVDERVVCANTLNIAIGEGGATFKARHSSGIEARVSDARATLDLAFRRGEQLKALYAELSATKMGPAALRRFVEELVPIGPSTDPDSIKAKNAQRIRDGVASIALNGEDLENVRGTAWAALQSAVEYADWRTRVAKTRVASAAENRFKRNYFRDDPIKVRALQILAPRFASGARATVEV